MTAPYTSNASVQVMLFADRLEVWNPGELPPTLTIAALRLPHASIPHNPLIAEPMFLATYAEKAGSGILDMIKLCRAAGVRAPEFRQDGGQFVQTLWRPRTAAAPQVTPTVTPTVTGEVTGEVVRLLNVCDGALPRHELQKRVGIKHDEHFRLAYMVPALETGLIEMTIPDKPNSRLQKYRLTPKGHAALVN